MGAALNQKTRLKEFCTVSWSDETLFGVLVEINSWADPLVKEKFIVDFVDNTKIEFKKGIIAEPYLVWAWQTVKVADLKQLQTVCEQLSKNFETNIIALTAATPITSKSKASYKAFLSIFQTFKGENRFRLARNFINAENRSVERFGDNNAEGVRLWLKYQAEFEDRPYIEQQSYPMESFLTKPNCQPYLPILQAVIQKMPTGDEKCAAACMHPNPKYSGVGIALAVNFKSTLSDGALNLAISPTDAQVLGNVAPDALPLGAFPENRLKEIYMAVKFRKGDSFPRCPCCYQLSK